MRPTVGSVKHNKDKARDLIPSNNNSRAAPNEESSTLSAVLNISSLGSQKILHNGTSTFKAVKKTDLA